MRARGESDGDDSERGSSEEEKSKGGNFKAGENERPSMYPIRYPIHIPMYRFTYPSVHHKIIITK